MAEREVVIPSQRAPFVGSDGRVNPTWYRFLIDLYERTGGGAEDKVEEGATVAATAEAAAATAQSAANTAQSAAAAAQNTADELEKRIDFDFELDLR